MSKPIFVGTWKLVSYEIKTADGGSMYPIGPNGMGILMYDAQGHMAVQLMQRDRPSFAQADVRLGTPDEIKAAFGGYFAYFGQYEVDEAGGVVTHHVEGCLVPNWIGGDQKRFYAFSANRLVLKTPPSQLGGVTGIQTLVWERIA